MTPTDPAAAALPGRRAEVASDAKITARIARPDDDRTPPPLPPPPALPDAARWLARAEANQPPPPVEVAPPSERPLSPQPAPPWVLPVLLAVTMLVVGIVIGALLFGHRGKACPPGKVGARAHGDQGSTSPAKVSRAAESTAL